MSIRKLNRAASRVCWWVFLGLVVAGLFVTPPFAQWWVYVPALAATACTVIGGRLTARDIQAVRRAPIEVAAPVSGRWIALNSPATRVPSHGTHAYGQSYAIDLVAEPTCGSRPAFARVWPISRREEAFPGFGAPVLAVADATVVRAADGRRDHRSRNSLLGVLYVLAVEGPARDMAGPGRLLGNHVILDLGNGAYALYAHLRRSSLTVREGDRVRAGQPLARCGNSGNSTEPHVHFQLMTHPDPDAATGLPFRYQNAELPPNGRAFHAPPPTPALHKPTPAEPIPTDQPAWR
ncbi:M23 family metallopeptidase [Streptomyces sp. CA-111067]|uniref:M23 family metallopeptidase n=1 Tax=Streptomyces sp. CA-111067 TaxID=3240046 RepID=UPI003D97F098